MNTLISLLNEIGDAYGFLMIMAAAAIIPATISGLVSLHIVKHDKSEE